MQLMGGYNPKKYQSPTGGIMGGWDNGAAGEQSNDSGSGDGAVFDNDGGND